jgi:hypothetical protein
MGASSGSTGFAVSMAMKFHILFWVIVPGKLAQAAAFLFSICEVPKWNSSRNTDYRD